MKKFILFIVLILGFIPEGRAQFTASSEIHYYINIEKSNSGGYWCQTVRFFNNAIDSHPFYLDPLENSPLGYLDREVKSLTDGSDVVSYDSRSSTNKYYSYRIVGNYYFFSKDRKELIYYYAPTNQKTYYRKVSRSELEELLKPNFDFLE